MEQNEEKKAPPAASDTVPEQELPLDTRLLSDAIIELNISRKNVAIYPHGHIQITKSVDRAFDVLLKLFAVRDEMTLGVAKDTLFVGQNYLDKKNPVYRDFALSLYKQGIAAVTFVRGLDLSELERFHQIITTKPEDIAVGGGIGKVIAGMDIPHIRIVPTDYSSFHLTEEQEILTPHAKTPEKSGTGLWQDFVSLLSSGTLARGGEGVSLKDSLQADPAELARLLNERKLNPQAALETYDHIISSHVRSAAEKKQVTREQSETLTKLNALMKGLHPDLRKQFLSVAYRNVAERAAPLGQEEAVVGGMSDDMVIEMLTHASEEGREISPTLTGLMGRLSSIKGYVPPGQGDAGGGGGSKPDPSAGPGTRAMEPGFESRQGTVPSAGHETVAYVPEHMEKLFDRESYEHYVVKDYDDMLRHISEKSGAMASSEADKFPIEEYVESLQDDRLDLQIGKAALGFLEEKIDYDDYAEFAKKLGAILPDLLASGNFATLLDAFQSLKRHAAEKKDPGVRDIASVMLRIFADPAYCVKAVEAFEQWADSRGKEGGAFLLALGHDALLPLFEAFAKDEVAGGRRHVFDALCGFGKAAVDEAVKRLNDPRSYVVRGLLMLIRHSGTREVVPAVKPLLQHKDPHIRIGALSVLLKFKEIAAVTRLRQELQSHDADIVGEAVALAGLYRVAEVVPDLVPLFRKVMLIDADYGANEELIKALGEIGDRRAIPALERLARSTWTIFPKSLDRMKLTLYESLRRYPRESIQQLLEIGETLNDDRIKRECRKLAEDK
jgi:hypothetical protein